jgi:tetratricopeptide (TPR) repeat protein
VQLTAVKWELKAGRVVEAERLKDAVVEHVNRWLGECHPVLAELFDIFARYYLRFREEEKRAVSYSKNALKNQEKLLGGNHIKLADAYYTLGDIHLHYAKKADALQSLKRAAQILTQNQATNSEPFVEIAIKVGQLCLANHAAS